MLYPLGVFASTRLLVWAGAGVAALAFDHSYRAWVQWDSGFFLSIARNGYASHGVSTAFFPAYPLAIRALALPLGGNDVLAGVLIADLACAAAFVLLWRLARALVGEPNARRTLLYLAIFPTTIFLSTVYSESLYLALSVAAFAAAVGRRWSLAGVATGLAALTRVSGVVLLPALALLAWRDGDRRAALGRLALSLPIMAAWPAYLALRFGHPLLFLGTEHSGWNRTFATAGPLGGSWDALTAAWHGARQILTGARPAAALHPARVILGGPPTSDAVSGFYAFLNVEQFAYGALLVALGILAWRRLGAAYGVFVLGSLALPLSSPVPSLPLLSMPRFALGVFPAFIVLGCLGARRRADRVIVVTLGCLLAANLVRWGLGIWVA